jgi:lipoprotein YgeR
MRLFRKRAYLRPGTESRLLNETPNSIIAVMANRTARFLSAAILVLAAAAIAPETASYTIQEGDTLFSIAKKAGIPLDIVCSYNGIADAGRLKPGMEIRFPRSYTIMKGDTLYGIAKSFSIPLPDLLELNRLKDGASIKAGEKLFLPSAAIASTAQDSVHSGNGGASGASGSKPSALVLPHPGRFEPFEGRISGLVFHGNQGDTVVSATNGEVEWVAPYWGWGKVVIIQSDDGLKCMYAGNEELLVNVGDRVKAGSEIAHLGVSPQGGGARLYFSIQAKSGQTVNPEKYFTKS